MYSMVIFRKISGKPPYLSALNYKPSKGKFIAN